MTQDRPLPHPLLRANPNPPFCEKGVLPANLTGTATEVVCYRAISRVGEYFSRFGCSVGPVVAAPRDQAHAVAVALHAETVAVILDLVKPLRTGRDFDSGGWKAELEGAGHAA